MLFWERKTVLRMVAIYLMKGIAHPTLEIILNESPEYLKREMDKDSGIPLIKI